MMNSLETLNSNDVADLHKGNVSDESNLTPMNGDGAHSDTQQPSRQHSHLDAAVERTAQSRSAKITFSDLPAELREMIWEYALPDSRVFNALVYASAGLKMQLLERSSLRMPIAHVCFESRQVVLKAGYRLAFHDEDKPDDPGVFFHPRKDVIERTLWGPGDFWGLK